MVGSADVARPPRSVHLRDRHVDQRIATVPTPTIDKFDNSVLEDLYDPGSVARGRAYAAEGRVRLFTSEGEVIKSLCEGSGRNTYLVTVRPRVRWGALDVDDHCSCPLGGACKHCVATIITARQRADDGSGPGAIPRADDWRRALADLSTDEEQPSARSGMALQFTVERTRASRWAPAPVAQVVVRALRRGRNDKWIKTGASWRELGSTHDAILGELDPLHVTTLRALMASGRIGTHYTNLPEVPLTQFGSDVWHHLDRAVQAGIPLLDEDALPTVSLSPVPARVSVDITAGDQGTAAMRTGFHVDGEPLDLDGGRGGMIGAPPHGLWLTDGDGLSLFPLKEPLHPTVARLVTSPDLVVPEHDLDELLDTYHPALARHASVISSDDSVLITASRLEGLVLTVERTALQTASLSWSARYRRGARITDHPLHRPTSLGRDLPAERTAVADLELPTHLLADIADLDGEPRDYTVTGLAIITLMTEVIPWLETKCNVTVEVRGDQPLLQEAVDDPLISLKVTDTGQGRDANDWFDLGIEVSIDDQPVDFASLFAALSRDEEALILPTGTWLRLDRPEFARLRELIDEARGLADPTGDSVARVNRFQAGWWEELAALGVVTEQSRRWADSVGRMASLAAPEPIAVPTDLDATLRPYQQEGLEWLAFLHRHRLGGILADDMGLGKTVQTLALCLHILQDRPDAKFLVVAPTSVVDNWRREATRFAPSLDVRTIAGTAARRGTSLDDEIDGANLIVTSYALFRLEYDAYARHDWELLLLDEAQFVKNHQGKTHACARRLPAATKIAITGTPLENSLMDLWSLLSITAPGLYPDPKRFSSTYRKPIEAGTAPELLSTLRRRISPLMRRRTKDEVLKELPPKIEQTIEVELHARHARIYQTQLQRQRQKVLGLVGDVQQNRFEILKSLTILRQLALDPGLVDEDHDKVGSAKLDRLLDDITQVVAEGHKALVFSQFTRYLARVRTRLDAAGIDHAYLDGRTRDRDKAISRFKDGDAPVFVISLKAGGFGLNLTEADYCFVLDPWWNPATETQAVDRAHRMGQENPVVVYRYVSTGTIEEKVMELKTRKAGLFSSVLDADGVLAGALTENDIRGLLDLG